jgi:hypothetical protein
MEETIVRSAMVPASRMAMVSSAMTQGLRMEVTSRVVQISKGNNWQYMQGFQGGFNADLSFPKNANHGNYGRGGYRYFKKNNYHGGSRNNFNLGWRAKNFGSGKGELRRKET